MARTGKKNKGTQQQYADAIDNLRGDKSRAKARKNRMSLKQINMYFQFSDFYKRDVSFEYSDDENVISQYDLTEGTKIEVDDVLRYEADKIDSYIESYDLLPTIGPPLVSQKFKELFSDLENSEIDFFNAEIIDSKGNKNNHFFAINILNIRPCLDEKRSVTESTSYGTLKIKKLFIIPNSLGSRSIVRMEEHESYIIVTEEFKKRCEDAGLKGINFIEEGHSIYKDV